MSKIIEYSVEARKKLKKGIDKLANAVSATLGGGGKNVILGKEYGSPHITKDGVTVAKEIELKDPIENIGAQAVKQAASKTNDVAGDGTTTATVLTQTLITEGMKSVEAGVSTVDFIAGVKKGLEHVEKHLKKNATLITTQDKLKQIATTSANNDEEIGSLIADAMNKVGPKGVITVEEARGIKTEVKYLEGMQFDRGYTSPHFITDAKTKTAILDDCYILFYDGKSMTPQSIIPILENITKKGKSLLIITSEDISNEVLAFLVVNILRGIFKVTCVKAPSFGDNMKAMMQDIACQTGGTIISEDRGQKLENTTLESLGKAKKVKVDKENTIIIGGMGKKDLIQARITEIENQITETTSSYDEEKLKERLAKLSGGAAVIQVGASTELELKEKQDRVNDAVNAAQAAVAEGVVLGAGIAKVYASRELKNIKTQNQDEQIGVQALEKTLQKPCYKIIENAMGSDKAPAIFYEINKSQDGKVFDVHKRTYILAKNKLEDPLKVTLSALRNAVSVATSLLRVECVIANEPKQEKNTPTMPQNGMPGMM